MSGCEGVGGMRDVCSGWSSEGKCIVICVCVCMHACVYMCVRAACACIRVSICVWWGVKSTLT